MKIFKDGWEFKVGVGLISLAIFYLGYSLKAIRRENFAPPISSQLPLYPNFSKEDFMTLIFLRHGYKEEELLAELENEKGVRLYSAANGDLFFVYGSTEVPNCSYRIVKHSWRK